MGSNDCCVVGLMTAPCTLLYHCFVIMGLDSYHTSPSCQPSCKVELVHVSVSCFGVGHQPQLGVHSVRATLCSVEGRGECIWHLVLFVSAGVTLCEVSGVQSGVPVFACCLRCWDPHACDVGEGGSSRRAVHGVLNW